MASAMLTDMYQLTMAYAYWKAGCHDKHAVFDLFFRKNPFGGEYTLFAGLSEVLDLIESFKFTAEDILYLKQQLPENTDPLFFDWLAALDCSSLTVHALEEGTVCFPRVPMLIVEGPLALCQLLETPLLNVCNFPSLVATNAARMRQAAGESKIMLEFGLRRAQGPDGAMTASKFSYLGGFDGTSNMLAGQRFGIPPRGTHAHSFVQSFSCLEEVKEDHIINPAGEKVPFLPVVLEIAAELAFNPAPHQGELAAFVAYAQAFPKTFLALVDTYETLKTGVPNFITVALALHRVGYQAVGIRLDSGDLAYLSVQSRSMFKSLHEKYPHIAMDKWKIFASNDINEETLHALNQQGHEVDAFGIGTHLVTCQNQPALGAVYKLVELDGMPRIKLSNAVSKVSIPAKKTAYRLFGSEGIALIDVMVKHKTAAEDADKVPQVGKRFMCKDPFDPSKRVFVTPHRVDLLHQCVWAQSAGRTDATVRDHKEALAKARERVQEQLKIIRVDIKRRMNPTPYKVSLSEDLYTELHNLWEKEQPVAELL